VSRQIIIRAANSGQSGGNHFPIANTLHSFNRNAGTINATDWTPQAEWMTTGNVNHRPSNTTQYTNVHHQDHQEQKSVFLQLTLPARYFSGAKWYPLISAVLATQFWQIIKF